MVAVLKHENIVQGCNFILVEYSTVAELFY